MSTSAATSGAVRATGSGPPRLYGNWRRARGFGIGQWGTGQTVTVFCCVLVSVLMINVGPVPALIVGLTVGVVVLLVAVRIGGTTAAQVLIRRGRFARAAWSGWTEYVGGVLTRHPRGADLPGPMAPLAPVTADDGRGGTQCLLWDRRTGLVTVVIRVSPIGVDLADTAQADAWVASWGAWLADLGYQPLVRWVAVTMDTAPTGGTTVGDYVRARTDERAPDAARQVLNELVAATPATSADVDARVAITFDPSRATPRPTDLLSAAAEVTRWLPGLEQGLAACGVAVLGRASVPWLAGRLRIAYDPSSRGQVVRTGDDAELLAWEQAGPVRASEQWTSWRHASGVSVSWALREAPRQAVAHRVLVPLLAPGSFARRVTLLYEPFDAEAAAAQVESEISNLALRRAWARRTKRDETQRDRDDAARATQAAREEAQGAGVERVTLYVSTTVTDEARLPSAVADVEQRAGQAKLRLRRLDGAHAAGFAGALGLGINPAELAARYRWR